MERMKTTDVYAQMIKASVSVMQVGEALGLAPNQHGRCRCPIHHGQDRNMVLRDGFYYCFVCHAHGDAIQLAEDVLNTTFTEAVKWLSDTFQLGIDIESDIDPETLRKAHKRLKTARTEALLHRLVERLQFELYLELFDELRALENLRDVTMPKPGEGFNDTFCDTVQKIHDVKEQIELMSLVCFRGKDDERTDSADGCPVRHAECSKRTG